MSDSLPDGWQIHRFDDIGVLVNEKVEPAETDLEIYVGLEHLDPESLKIRRWGTPSDVIGAKLRVYPGDIIFGKRRAYQRKLAIADFDGICSAHAMVLRANEDIVFKEFFPFFLQSDLFMERALDISVGSLSPTINWKTLKKQEFPLPPLEEQKRIAEVLWAAEESIWKTEDAIGMAERYKKVLMKHLFTYGPVGIEKINKIGKIPNHWKVVKLAEVVDFVMGQSPPGESYNENGEGVPFLQGKTEFGDLYPVHVKYTTDPRKMTKEGDVLMSVRAPVGDLNIANREYCIGRGLGALALKDGNNRYLYYQLLFLQSKIESLGAGSTFKAITKGTLANISIPFPPKSERIKIEKILSKVSSVIDSLKSEEDSLKHQKTIMLNQLLGGSISLRGKSNV